jgi:nucleotide-binding universal stress UspA family protein
MPEHAIVGIDLSPSTDDLCAGLDVLERLGVHAVTLVHVLGGHYPQAPELRHRDRYAARLGQLAVSLPAGFAVATQVRTGHVGAELESAGRELGADLIVAGSRGHTPWRDLFLGSTVLELLRTSLLPVLLLPLPPRRPDSGGGVVLATDGSASAAVAEQLALRLARRAGGIAVTVLEPSRRPPEGEPDPVADAARDHLDELAAAGMDTLLERGHLPEAVTRIADERAADVIVVGARGRNPIAGLLLGSTAEHLLRTARRPVLVVRDGAR